MKCLMKYKWVKLPRHLLPQGKGLLGQWAQLASRAAFRTGKGLYCGYVNEVSAGGWSGGIVGIKAILGQKQKGKALAIQAAFGVFRRYFYFLLQPCAQLSNMKRYI